MNADSPERIALDLFKLIYTQPQMNPEKSLEDYIRCYDAVNSKKVNKTK